MPAAKTEIELIRIAREQVDITVKGTAPLIVHRFDEKAKAMMLDAQTSRTRVKKEPKDPEALYRASLHVLPDGAYGFPAVGFKAAIVGAARYFEGITMTALKSGMFVRGEGPEQLVRVVGTPQMREDAVRVGMGTADLRYRGMFPEWSATLSIVYIPTMLTLQSVFALVDAGGLGGVGEWRPSAPKSYTGAYGTFEVVES